MPPAFALSQDQTLRFIKPANTASLKPTAKPAIRTDPRPIGHRIHARGTDKQQPLLSSAHIRIHEQPSKSSHHRSKPEAKPQTQKQIKLPIPRIICSHIQYTIGRRPRIPSSTDLKIKEHKTTDAKPPRRDIQRRRLSPATKPRPGKLENRSASCKKNLQRRSGEALSRTPADACQHDDSVYSAPRRNPRNHRAKRGMPTSRGVVGA